jgi:hypothetical protein
MTPERKIVWDGAKFFLLSQSASDHDVDRVAPTGWYMLLLVNAAGVPSMAQSIHLS